MSNDGEVITMLPFARSGYGADSYQFKEMVACCWHNFLPNGRPVWPRFCIPGMETEIILPPDVPYEVYGEYPPTKLVSAKRGIYMVKFDVPCVLLPVGAMSCLPSEKPMYGALIVNTEGDIHSEALRAAVEKREQEALRANQDELRTFVWKEDRQGDPESKAHRIRSFLKEGSFVECPKFMAWRGYTSFLYSLPRPVFFAICQAISNGLREKTLGMPVQTITVGT